MSLPKGFGESTENCPKCDRRIVWQGSATGYKCTNGCNTKRSVNPYGRGIKEIPITKHELGLYAMRGILVFGILSCIGLMFSTPIGGLVILIMFVIFYHLFGHMACVMWRGWTLEETFPWLKSIMGTRINTGWHFKEEREYGE